MCNVAQSYIDKGMEQGIEKGELTMLQKLVASGRISMEDAAAEMNVTVKGLEELFADLQN